MARKVALLGLLVGALACASVGGASDTEPIRAATSRFYTALNAMFAGQLAPMEEVWSHSADVTYLGPGGGIEVGWEQVRASWQRQADQKLGGKVEPGPLRIFVGPELAVVQNLEQGANVGPEGQREPVSIRATSVFRKEDGRWKMISHHTDLLPFLD